jgi:hypothetical protein
VLQYDRGNGTLWAHNRPLKAYAKPKTVEAILPADLLARLKQPGQHHPVTASVTVEEFGNDRKIVAILSWRT